MYLQNKYTNVYNSIIERAKSRELPKEIYTEKHHIIPKSLGGSNSKNNLVNLTAREHRLCHLLLPKMTMSEEHTKKMWYAAWMILRVENQGQTRLVSKGKFYELAKLEFTKLMSNLHKGKIVSVETRKKMSDSRKNHAGPNKGKKMSTEQKLKLSKAHTGKVIAQLTVDKILESRKEYKHSEETRKKISEGNKGKAMPSKTDDQKKSISKKLKGRVMSEETKKRMSESRKAYWNAKRAC
jgi:5-methylcytosine-specific restriction endonuclease McrA